MGVRIAAKGGSEDSSGAVTRQERRRNEQGRPAEPAVRGFDIRESYQRALWRLSAEPLAPTGPPPEPLPEMGLVPGSVLPTAVGP